MQTETRTDSREVSSASGIWRGLGGERPRAVYVRSSAARSGLRAHSRRAAAASPGSQILCFECAAGCANATRRRREVKRGVRLRCNTFGSGIPFFS